MVVMCRPADMLDGCRQHVFNHQKKPRGRISAFVQLQILNEKFKFVNMHKAFAVLLVYFLERQKDSEEE